MISDGLVCSPETMRVSLGSMLPARPDITLPFVRIEDRRMRAWIDDSVVDRCFRCLAAFSFYKRKHHCRMCGRIFCHGCCNRWRRLPRELVISKDGITGHATMFVDWSSIAPDEHRLCIGCDKRVTELAAFKRYAQVLSFVGLGLQDYATLCCVSRSWAKISTQYMSRFRELQYYLHDRPYNEIERKSLWVNRHLFRGHRLWFKRALMAVRTEAELDELMRIWTSAPKHTCERLLCSRMCGPLRITDLVCALMHLRKRGLLINRDDAFIDLLCQTIRTVEAVELLPTLAWWIRFVNGKGAVYETLLARALDDPLIALHMFWHIILAAELYPERYEYRSMVRSYLLSIPGPLRKRLKQGYFVGRALNNLGPSPAVDGIAQALEKITVCYLPTGCAGRPTLLFPAQSRITTSANCPVYIPGIYHCTNRAGSKVRHQSSLLYKQEDVRADQIVINVIRYMDHVLKHAGLELDLVTYEVIPTSKRSGCIKIVPDSYTLYKVKEELKFTIQNFILEHNPTLSIQTVRERFMRSCAGACVVSFLLGLGDRHLENIMITKDGRLFHIDFDYILGHDAKPFQPEMRLTPEMIDAMGGVTSRLYRDFETLCTDSYNCLRQHVDAIAIMLSELTVVDPDRYSLDKIMRQIIRRFVPGESMHAAQLQFKTILHKSWSSQSSRIADFIHRQHKESYLGLGSIRKACVSGLSSLFGSAFS